MMGTGHAARTFACMAILCFSLAPSRVHSSIRTYTLPAQHVAQSLSRAHHAHLSPQSTLYSLVAVPCLHCSRECSCR